MSMHYLHYYPHAISNTDIMNTPQFYEAVMFLAFGKKYIFRAFTLGSIKHTLKDK